jgi:membrane-associated phospholipid phosphatase
MLRNSSVFLLLIYHFSALAQSSDTLIVSRDTSVRRDVRIYSSPDFDLIYTRPKPLQFITQQPKTFAHSAKVSFNRKNIPVLLSIAAATGLLISVDQKITNGVQDFYRDIHVSTYRNYKTIVGFNLGNLRVNAYEAPQNFNTILYTLGEGSSSVFIAGGLGLYGLIKNDFRSRQTSNQIMQAIIGLGITTQILKRMTGRESPFTATKPGGEWRPFTNLKTYQGHVPMHDAFPSGHLATAMATVTVLADNYPEKKWIKPLGYGITSLAGVAMIGNGVHWAGDYPLALGLGYVMGKVSVKMNRLLQQKVKKD